MKTSGRGIQVLREIGDRDLLKRRVQSVIDDAGFSRKRTVFIVVDS